MHGVYILIFVNINGVVIVTHGKCQRGRRTVRQNQKAVRRAGNIRKLRYFPRHFGGTVSFFKEAKRPMKQKEHPFASSGTACQLFFCIGEKQGRKLFETVKKKRDGIFKAVKLRRSFRTLQTDPRRKRCKRKAGALIVVFDQRRADLFKPMKRFAVKRPEFQAQIFAFFL